MSVFDRFHGDLNATCRFNTSYQLFQLYSQLTYECFLLSTDPVGKISESDENLISTARECLDEAIRVCKPGFLFRDLGKIISGISRERGCSTNKT